MRLNQVGKEQATAKEAAHLAQTQQAGELVKKSEEQARTVNETKNLEYGPEAVNDEEEHPRGKSEPQDARNRRKDTEEEELDVFRDPDLGSNIDISG